VLHDIDDRLDKSRVAHFRSGDEELSGDEIRFFRGEDSACENRGGKQSEKHPSPDGKPFAEPWLLSEIPSLHVHPLRSGPTLSPVIRMTRGALASSSGRALGSFCTSPHPIGTNSDSYFTPDTVEMNGTTHRQTRIPLDPIARAAFRSLRPSGPNPVLAVSENLETGISKVSVWISLDRSQRLPYKR
jgi:hypothetical protein